MLFNLNNEPDIQSGEKLFRYIRDDDDLAHQIGDVVHIGDDFVRVDFGDTTNEIPMSDIRVAYSTQHGQDINYTFEEGTITKRY